MPIKERNRLLPSYLRIYVNTNQIKSKSEIKYLAQYLGTFVYIITFVYPSIIFFCPNRFAFFLKYKYLHTYVVYEVLRSISLFPTFVHTFVLRRYVRTKIAGGYVSRCHFNTQVRTTYEGTWLDTYIRISLLNT